VEVTAANDAAAMNPGHGRDSGLRDGHPAEFAFVLPQGLVDADGAVHRDGTMRLATAFDEIEPLKDPRVRSNPGYLVVILLARVITRLGGVEYLNTRTVENLYAADLAYLQEFYQRINQTGSSRLQVACPHCSQPFEVETAGQGG
jgi:hypothetical protein